MTATEPLSAQSLDILRRLGAYRSADAPTHGGRVLSYVYDPGLAELDELAAAAMRAVQPVNGLDPTTFPSVAALEADLVAFAREMLGNPHATGSITSGGTESCILAVVAARERWRARREAAGERDVLSRRPRIVLASSAHAAFHKAAHLLGLQAVVVPVDAASGEVGAARLVDAIDADPHGTALVVVSAPSYPHGVIDPVDEVAAAAAQRGVACHVDACVGGWVLPWWQAAGGSVRRRWDLSVPGVSSISADIHKYGFAPKGASVLLFADPELDRARYFAITSWLGYPVVNPTLLGSRSAAPLAAAWAIVNRLGRAGYVERTRSTVAATAAVRAIVAGIEGLRVVGDPTGPLIAVAADENVAPDRRVHPHLWCGAVARSGIVLQGQPALEQSDGTRVPASAHLTITPVTAGLVDELRAVLPAAADAVRGMPGGAAALAAAAAASGKAPAIPDPVQLAAGARSGAALDMSSVLALIEAMPRDESARLLVAFLQEFTRPHASSA